MKPIILYLFIILALGLFSCTENWDDHYLENEASVASRLWDTLITHDEFSQFVSYTRDYGLEDFITSANSKTLFIPRNEAFTDFVNTTDTTGFKKILEYLVSPNLLPVRSVEKSRKLLTLSGKYALIENDHNNYTIDGVDIIYASNLFLDGRYYQISQVVLPKPNIYEYIQRINPMISEYIDDQDTIILDLEESTPVDFNEQGQTIYDSVIIIKNKFEEEYFPISEEFRERNATVLIPSTEQYHLALDEMARNLGGSYTGYADIPDKWQFNVLIPTLLNQGFYGGMVDVSDFFIWPKIQNIIGDSIKIEFDVNPDSRYICSNGIAYEYSSFTIDDSLYMGEKIIEGESLVESVGFEKYAWNEGAKISGRTDFQPVQIFVEEIASNDTIIDVSFESNFSGEYTVEITFKDVFPGEYQLLWRSNSRTTGVYAVYVNGEKPLDAGGFPHTEFDTYTLNGPIFSAVIPGKKFYPEMGFNQKDFLVTNLTEYGDVAVKFEYLRQGMGSDPGFSLDFIALIPRSIAEQTQLY